MIIFNFITMKLFIIFLAILALSATTATTTNQIWPKPVSFSSHPQGERVTVSPCDISYNVQSSQSD